MRFTIQVYLVYRFISHLSLELLDSLLQVRIKIRSYICGISPNSPACARGTFFSVVANYPFLLKGDRVIIAIAVFLFLYTNYSHEKRKYHTMSQIFYD